MSELSLVAPKIAKLLPMLATHHDGEVVATVRAIDRTLRGAGLDFHHLVDALCGSQSSPYVPPAPSKKPETWTEIAEWCRTRDAGDLTQKERTFVRDLARRAGTNFEPSEKQLKWLRGIYVKLDWGYVP